MATDQDNFADRLIRSRSQHGWSQLELSKASGVAAAQISRYEQGNNTPRPQVVAKLAAALKVSFDWLLSGAAKDAADVPPDMRAYMLSVPADLLARIFIAAGETHRTIDEEIVARLESSFAQSTIDRDVALAASAAGAVMKGLERVNENVMLFAKRIERIEAKIGIAGGAEPMRMGTPTVVMLDPAPEDERHQAVTGPAPEQPLHDGPRRKKTDTFSPEIVSPKRSS